MPLRARLIYSGDKRLLKDRFYICHGCGDRRRLMRKTPHIMTDFTKRQSKNSYIGVCPSCVEKGVKLDPSKFRK